MHHDDHVSHKLDKFLDRFDKLDVWRDETDQRIENLEPSFSSDAEQSPGFEDGEEWDDDNRGRKPWDSGFRARNPNSGSHDGPTEEQGVAKPGAAQAPVGTHRRITKLGTSSAGEDAPPRFDGTDATNWVSRVLYYFDHVMMPDAQRLHYAVMLYYVIIGRMLGTTGAEMMKKVITWLTAHLSTVEQQAMVSIWLKVAKNTEFDEWLRDWWEGMAEHVSRVEEGFRPPDALMEVVLTYHNGDIPGQVPSYRDPLGETFGCKHYKRNCMLLTPCCDKLYTCIRCHDEQTDHSVDRKAVTEMMCMKCMVIQPIGQKCMSQSCNGFSMGSHYCRICKLFDVERLQIYHCPYCNICRVGMGLGIDYFHCMNCNGCMGKSLVVHTCREKRMEDNCPVCKECIFASYTALKALPCGHVMHSSCFKNYICSDYTCPSCSKSLGDMQVFFGMLDSILAKAKIPEEYSGRSQVILCNDCEQTGTASFHWLYHKCSNCGSYYTRMLGYVLKSML
ncbi:zinc finger protein BRUTUS-like At1g74770 [Salvia hispanica]|uniref:zinc finger protein BRUTUS-like At1g74770 n=1 Tax=Salvia hispanica TaxID=49212 RepID=UPI0020097E07|nr:zinc finger protein BRUTUS-like At1g74770 [Salvia hispanica]